jgi:hypothetical protein
MKTTLTSIVYAAGAGTIVLFACSAIAVQSKPASKAILPEAISIVFTGEQNGHLTPCGCAKPMLGGLPRRSSFMKTASNSSALVSVENGDIVETIGRQNELKAETTVEALNKLDYAVLNLGEKDFQLGIPFLRSLQSRFKGVVLSANALGEDNSPIFKPFALVRKEINGGLRKVAIIGVISAQFAENVTPFNPELRIENPEKSIERVKQEMVSASDFRVLLYHGSKAEAQDLARQFPIFDLVVFSHEGDHPVDAETDGKSVLASAGQDGKYVGVAKLMTGKLPEVSYTELAPIFADEAEVQQIKLAYLERVNAEDLLAKVPKSPIPGGKAYMGGAACKTCHGAPHKIWVSSPHSHAMQSLKEVNEDRDPECVACHVVGLDRQSGYVNREKTPHLLDVGCESCHGPASAHLKNPTTKMGKVGAAACAPCHIPQHSPTFDFQKFWPKIKH